MASLSVKKKARSRINNAIRDKHIKRPDRCQWCKSTPPRGKDGRSLVQFHHLSERYTSFGCFICTQCHAKVHK